MRTKLALIIAVTAFVQQLLVAQGIVIRSNLEEKQLAAGVQTVLQIEIEGGEPESIPKSIEAAGLTIGHIGERRQSLIINGVGSNKIIILYAVIGNEVGTYEIPAVPFRVQGQVYKTEPLSLKIIELSGQQPITADRPYFMTFQAASAEAFVNEIVPIECKLYVRGSNSLGSPGRPRIEGSDKFVIKPFPNTFRVQLEQIEGLPFTTTRFPSTVFALSAGDYEIGPGVITASITMLPNNPDGRFPGRNIFSEPRTITSNTLEFKVKPLPDAGRPNSFRGAVGTFSLEVQTADTDIRVGDPISIDIKISGAGNFDSVVAPEIAEEPSWKTYRSNRVEGGASADIEQTVIFNQVVIPMAQHTELPTMEFSYFNPETAEYVTLKSPAIPLKIAIDPDTERRASSAAFAAIGIPSEQLDDILFIRSTPPRWTPMVASVWGRPSFWLLQIVPFLAFAGVTGIGLSRAVKIWMARRRVGDRLTFDQVKEKLGHERVSRGLFYKLVLEYFYRWRGQNEQLLAKVSDEGRAVLDRIAESGHTFLYSGSHDEGQPVGQNEKKAALKALNELEALTPTPSSSPSAKSRMPNA